MSRNQLVGGAGEARSASGALTLWPPERKKGVSDDRSSPEDSRFDGRGREQPSHYASAASRHVDWSQLRWQPDQVLSAFLEYFNALQGEELRIEMLVDRRGVQRAEEPNAMNALDHGMPILFQETPLAPERAIRSEA